MATGTMGLRRWQPGGWSGFAAGAALGAVLVAAAWGSTAVAGSRTGELAATGTGDAVGAYLAVVAEHERLLGETLALELAAERERSRLSVVAPTGLAPVESYAAEHGRLVGATLGGEFTGGPSVEVTAAPVAPGESYVEEHGRLLEGTLGVAIPLDFTAGVTPEDGGGQARPAAGVQLDFTAGVTPEDGGGEARPARSGETLRRRARTPSSAAPAPSSRRASSHSLYGERRLSGREGAPLAGRPLPLGAAGPAGYGKIVPGRRDQHVLSSADHGERAHPTTHRPAARSSRRGRRP